MSLKENNMNISYVKKAFTLIELLVVISIIALLLSIIIPSLKKAKDSAKRISCLSNIKAQYLAQMNYATDNNGSFAGHTDNSPEYFRSQGSPNSNVWKMMDRAYIEDSEVFLCPLLNSFGGYFSDISSGGGENSWGGAWDAPDYSSPFVDVNPQHILAAYMWFANFRDNLMLPNDEDNPRPVFEFRSSEGIDVSEPAWPNRDTECSSTRAFISHRVSFTSFVFWDLSHGGSYSDWTDPSALSSSTENTPVGYADGHIKTVLKSKMSPRAFSSGSGGIEYYY